MSTMLMLCLVENKAHTQFLNVKNFKCRNTEIKQRVFTDGSLKRVLRLE